MDNQKNNSENLFVFSFRTITYSLIGGVSTAIILIIICNIFFPISSGKLSESNFFLLLGTSFIFGIVIGGLLASFMNMREERRQALVSDKEALVIQDENKQVKSLVKNFVLVIIIGIIPVLYHAYQQDRELSKKINEMELRFANQEKDRILIQQVEEIAGNSHGVLMDIEYYNDEQKIVTPCPQNIDVLRDRADKKSIQVPDNMLYAREKDGAGCHIGIMLNYSEDKKYGLYQVPDESNFDSTGIYADGFNGRDDLIYDWKWPMGAK